MATVNVNDVDLWISDEELDQLAAALERLVIRARDAEAQNAPHS